MNCVRSRKTAQSEKEREEIWEIRRSISAALFRIGPKKINEDVVVPRSRIPELIDGVEEIKREHGLKIVCFGHAGDGNIHVNFMVSQRDEEERVERAVRELFELVLRLEGSISGEHGIGFTKSAYIRMELSPGLLQLMWEVKRVFDPNYIMNPGKIFPPRHAG